jgi:hypothetical protein
MSKTNGFENSILNLIFRNTAISNGGGTDFVRGGAAAGDFKIALYTANPGEGGSGTSANEANYTGYSRVSVPRTAGGWTISIGANVVSNAAKITFGACTAGTNTITHFAILTDDGGDGTNASMLFYGALSAPLSISPGITPEFNIGTLTVTED